MDQLKPLIASSTYPLLPTHSIIAHLLTYQKEQPTNLRNQWPQTKNQSIIYTWQQFHIELYEIWGNTVDRIFWDVNRGCRGRIGWIYTLFVDCVSGSDVESSCVGVCVCVGGRWVFEGGVVWYYGI